MLEEEGWTVNHKRVERLWRREGLKVPRKQPKRRRLWFNDGSCIRLRPQYRDHVWTYDFVQDRTHDGRAVRMLTLIDEYSRECLAIDVERKLNSQDVLNRLTELFTRRGAPRFIRSDNGSEFTAKLVREWLKRLDVGTLFIEPGSPWENGYIESFNGNRPTNCIFRAVQIHDIMEKGGLFTCELMAFFVVKARRGFREASRGRFFGRCQSRCIFRVRTAARRDNKKGGLLTMEQAALLIISIRPMGDDQPVIFTGLWFSH